MPGSKSVTQPAILEEAIKVAAGSADKNLHSGDNLRELLTRFYRHVPEEDLADSSPADLAGAVLSHYDLARHRAPRKEVVRVHNPSLDAHGWQTGHTVVEIVTDDMPFLVDSITAELSRQSRPIHQVVHPIVVVQRDDEGNLTQVVDMDASGKTSEQANWPKDAQVESWMHVQIDLESDETERTEIEAQLLRVLDDVRCSVEDWPQMTSKAIEVAKELTSNVPSDLVEEAQNATRLIEWLADHHFTFLGYREYDLIGELGEEALRAVPGSGLGILRCSGNADSASFDRLSEAARKQARERNVLVLTKANSRATVHRAVFLDYVGVKKFDAAGNVIGECRFLGLLTSTAYTQSVRNIPVISEKVQRVREKAGFAAGSHSDKDLQTLLETYPRDELLQMSTEELYETAMSVMHLQERRQTRVFLRRDSYGRFMSCLVFLPRDRYTTEVRIKMQDILKDFFHAKEVDFSARLSESVLARLHFVARVPKGEVIAENFDSAQLEEQLTSAARSWVEDLRDAMRAELGEEEAGRVLNSWDDLPAAYKEGYDPRLAVVDLRRIQCLVDSGTEDTTGVDPALAVTGQPVNGLVMNLYQPMGVPANTRRFKLYRTSPLTLTSVLPIFRNLGVEVLDERPYELERNDGATGYVYDFGLSCPGNAFEGARERFTEAFAAAWAGRTESDGLNRLVVFAKLTWRQVVMVRTYVKYMQQAGTPFSQNYIEGVLLDNASITAKLVELFEARFDPSKDWADEEREAAQRALKADISSALDAVESLDADRILRLALNLITATVRTNFYQVAADGQPKTYVSVKLLPRNIEELPEPRPAFEIWTCSPRVEGTHFRFSQVARGGLRWSDRREDFRTEILGLVKAQMVKNAVIIPNGAKGGFVAKQLPDPSVDRDAWYQEGVNSYKLFISSLLDITDNYGARQADGNREIIAPQNVVRHDGDDPYLVVAADKGTAAFSDIANGVAIDYGHWLGDAFASGGSVGYDHKEMGITARGAWESVKRHFREMGVDTQTEDFTAVGIGDMSGDVFGNGMLLSEHIRLVAAFNHMHIFIDPNPVAATSYQERHRLFHSERGTWDKYDPAKISAGGGVFDRSAKSIPLTDEIRTALGIDPEISKMTPTELIRAILLAPTDLLWNGGIGTYIKAEDETHIQVGDRANDAIRLNGKEVNVKVIGEGGNLGMTQHGRIEAALHGVRLNTDAIDNSAGVDCSDHEVNIKILLDQAVADGDLTTKQRNALLASMTEEVGELVLDTNREQNVLLSNGRHQADWMLSTHHRFIKALEASGDLDRELEGLPSDKEIKRREAAGIGLTSPELSVLVAYSKITLENIMSQTTLPQEEWFAHVLTDYFPKPLVEQFGDRLPEHPLAREIITTVVINEMVNRGGITFAFRAADETGASIEDVIRAYVKARSVFGMHEFTKAVDELPASVSTAVQTDMYLEFRRLLDRSVRWFLHNRPTNAEIGTECERYLPLVRQHGAQMDSVLVGYEQGRMRTRMNTLIEAGVPDDLARWEAGLLDSYSLLDVLGLVDSHDAPADYVTTMYFKLSDRFHIDKLLGRVAALPRDNRWASLARSAARDDLYAALESLTAVVLDSVDAATADTSATDPADIDGIVEGWITRWEEINAEPLQRVQRTLTDINALEVADLATMSVVLRQIRAVVKSAAGNS